MSEWYSEVVRRRVTSGGGDVFAKLLEIDEHLVRKGFPPMSDWWKDTLGRFYQSRKRQIIIRAGRRAGKSSTLCRIAVAEALFGGHVVPPGDVGVVAIVSVNMGQAEERVRTIRSILEAIGMREGQDYVPRAGEIEIVGRPVIFRVFSATRGAAVGFTSICVICDEVAIWRNDATGANPAKEILGWLRPTMSTQPRAKMFLSSSPFSTLDAHHEAFERGDTDGQMVALGTSFECNPTLDEAQTHADEPDELEWQRQYMAVPMSSGVDTFFSPAAVDRSVDGSLLLPATPRIGDVISAGGDFGFRSDSSALVVVHRRGDVYYPGELLEIRPQPGEPLAPSKVVGTFSDVLRRHGCRFLMADGHYRQSIAEHLEAASLEYVVAPEGQKGIQETYIRARALLNQGQLRLPKHDKLLRQMREVVSRPTPGGGVSITSPRKSGGGHGDLVSALVLAVWQRDGHQVEKAKPTFGTPEYWAWIRSAEYIAEQERETIAREGAEVSRSDDEDSDAGDSPWWDR